MYLFIAMCCFGYLGLHVAFALFREQGLSHAESDGRLIERLVCRDGHSHFIAHAQQE